jgi:acid phosphatase
VFIVVEENTDYSSVVGGASTPYLDSLASQYALATQYYANTHPSVGNYFMLTVGRIITNRDGFAGTVTEDNIVRELLAAVKTWKAYAEDLPLVGYTGDGPLPYARRHNPLSYLSDVVNDPVQRQNLVPFSQFAIDLANNALPDFSFIVPNLCSDAHDCSLSHADAWLKTNVAPLIASPVFQRDGLLIITFDEARSDGQHGGGRVVWLAVSPKAKRAYRSAAFYQHESTLRLMAEGLGLTRLPGAAATAPSMAEFFSAPQARVTDGGDNPR